MRVKFEQIKNLMKGLKHKVTVDLTFEQYQGLLDEGWEQVDGMTLKSPDGNILLKHKKMGKVYSDKALKEEEDNQTLVIHNDEQDNLEENEKEEENIEEEYAEEEGAEEEYAEEDAEEDFAE